MARLVSPHLRWYLLRSRADAGISQAKLAKLAGTDVMTISRIERGLNHPRTSLCLRLAHYLRLADTALLTLSGWLGTPADWVGYALDASTPADGAQASADYKRAFRLLLVGNFLVVHSMEEKQNLNIRIREVLGVGQTLDSSDLDQVESVIQQLMAICDKRECLWSCIMSEQDIMDAAKGIGELLSSLTPGAFLALVLANNGHPDEILTLLGVLRDRLDVVSIEQRALWETTADRLAEDVTFQGPDVLVSAILQGTFDGVWEVYRRRLAAKSRSPEEAHRRSGRRRTQHGPVLESTADDWLLHLPKSWSSDAILEVLNMAQQIGSRLLRE